MLTNKPSKILKHYWGEKLCIGWRVFVFFKGEGGIGIEWAICKMKRCIKSSLKDAIGSAVFICNEGLVL